jgi:hypothetical protein
LRWRDGNKEIYCADRLGNIHILNQDLSPRGKSRIVESEYGRADLRFGGFAQFGIRSERLLLLTSTKVEVIGSPWVGNDRKKVKNEGYYDNSLLIVNPKLDVVANYVVATNWGRFTTLSAQVIPSDVKNRPQILLLGCAAEILELKRDGILSW